MNRNETVGTRPLRGAAATWVSMLFVIAPAVVACGGQTLEQSTETGNPPLVAADRIDVKESNDGEVELRGSAGAIEPGGATVLVTNSTTGEEASTDARPNGAFSVTLPGSIADDYRIEVTADGNSAEATLPAPSNVAAPDSGPSACEKICAGPRECGARETLFPVLGCDCDDRICECTEAECVAACEADTLMYQNRSVYCAVSLADVHACILEASCEQFRDGDADALMAIPSCERALEFEDVCGFGSGECGPSAAGGTMKAGSDVYETCDMATSCGGTDYGLDCRRGDGGTYECTCRTDGASLTKFSSVDACAGLGNPLRGSEVHQLAFACGFQLPGITDQTEGCGPPSVDTRDGSPGACSIAASCVNGDFAVNCEEVSTGVQCNCLRDGVKVSETLLDAAGCMGSRFNNDDDGYIATMNAICEF